MNKGKSGLRTITYRTPNWFKTKARKKILKVRSSLGKLLR